MRPVRCIFSTPCFRALTASSSNSGGLEKWRRHASRLSDEQLSLIEECDFSGQTRNLTEQHVALEGRVLLFSASYDVPNVVQLILESLYRQVRSLAPAQDRIVHVDAIVRV
jgi:hypothetical protein